MQIFVKNSEKNEIMKLNRLILLIIKLILLVIIKLKYVVKFVQNYYPLKALKCILNIAKIIMN